MRRAVNKILGKFGYELTKTSPPATPNPIHLWETDPDFLSLYSTIERRTLVDKQRCFVLYKLAQQAAAVDGDVAEIGVYKGGTAYLLANRLRDGTKRLHLFDTFAGMPSTDPQKDIHNEGDFDDTSLASVKDFMAGFDNVDFFPGLFPETALPVTDLRFALVHVDVDIYRSVIDCCEFFYPRMVGGGVLVFDDYGFVTCPGALEAVDTFFASKPEVPCYLPTGQCLVIKGACRISSE
jgi:O-methyltransferase